MEWIIPGTVLTVPIEETECIPEKLTSMFLGGGMVLSQVAAVTGLEPYTIQNWVKRGFLAPPVRKRYTLRQLCRIININMLKGVLPMEQICGLLSYVNGSLDDESDDLIDDAQLYFMFVGLASRIRELNTPESRETHLKQVLADYEEPAPGAKLRVEKVLRIMLTAWASAQLQHRAVKLLEEL